MTTVATDIERNPVPAEVAAGAQRAACLKASLLLHGVAVDEHIEERLRRDGHWIVVRSEQLRLELHLPDGTIVTPPVLRTTSSENTWRLAASRGGAFELRRGAERHPVYLPIRPSFYDQQTGSGRRIGDFAQVYGSALVLGAAQACGYSIAGGACRFCRVGSRGESERTFGVTAYEVAEAVRLAFRERHLQFVFLAAASFDADDGGIGEMEPLVKAIRRHASALVLAAMHPPRTLRWIDHAYAIGVDGISFNLELHDLANLERHLPGRARYIGRSRYLQALRHAAKIFPRGAVWTELLLGASATAATLEFALSLYDLGVVPFFVPVLPETNPRPRSLPFRASEAEVNALLHGLLNAREDLASNARWLPQWPHLIGPQDIVRGTSNRWSIESRSRTSRLELFVLRNLARLRRSLRVRDLDEHDLDPSA
ncbi:MAG: hypothetical protein KatS3mg077_1098 [Candidatus Binatia bacterium]|nr:MAG: hypothetical protein KatS3mg077_1098 [Candidatus Binatia bacterium]